MSNDNNNNNSDDMIKLSIKQHPYNGIYLHEPNIILKDLADKYKDKDFEDKPQLSRLYNKFSGTYISPTFIKGFLQCPMRLFLNYLDPRTDSPVTNLGSAAHRFYELVIKNKILLRDEQEDLANNIFKEFNLQKRQLQTYKKYIDNFLHLRGYDGQPLFDDNDESKYHFFTEQYLRDENLTVLGCDLGCCLTLIDRLDIDMTNKVINIVDYKTGHVSYVDHILDMYRDQMMIYTWQCKSLYEGFDVNAYLYLPDTDGYLLVDTEDLELQSKLVDKVFEFYEQAQEAREKEFLPANVGELCRYCNQRQLCNAYQRHTLQDDELFTPVEVIEKEVVIEELHKEVESDGIPEEKTEE